ncbi:MAG: hypothetical protein AB7U29_03450 [Desulfobulbus sp.]
MTILASELKPYYAVDMSDLSTSGGRPRPASVDYLITSGALQNVFPHIFRAKRVAGCLDDPQHRKIIWRNCNAAGETLFAPGTYLFRPNPSDAWVWKVIGTMRSTKADLTGSEAMYGPGLLNAAVIATATVLVVNVKHTRMTGCFAVGRPTRIADKATVTASGNEEEFIPSDVAIVGTQLTITIPAPGLANGYAAGATVFSVYYPSAGELECSVDNWSETTDTYNEAAAPVIGDNIGSDEQTWTFQKLTATTFSCTGDTLGTLTTIGSTATDYAPVNPENSKPYFTLYAAGWLGELPDGYTLVFQTHPPCLPVHEFREWPPLVNSFAGDGITSVLEGETA